MAGTKAACGKSILGHQSRVISTAASPRKALDSKYDLRKETNH
jgi:hypothetical protein